MATITATNLSENIHNTPSQTFTATNLSRNIFTASQPVYNPYLAECFTDSLYHYENIDFPEKRYAALPYIKKVEILKPNKVIRFTFYPIRSFLTISTIRNEIDEKVIKTVCLDEDTFDFEFSFYLAYAKYMYGDILTPHGIEKKAKEFMDNKDMIKLVKKGMKVYRDQVKEEERIAKEKKVKESARLNKIAKKKAKKARAKEARIAEIAEAINRTK